MQETQVRSLGQEDPLEEKMSSHPSILAMDKGAWWATVYGVTKSWARLSKQHHHYESKRKFTKL